MNRSFLLENLSDMLDEIDARLTALEARPQAPDYWRKWASSEVEIKTAELDAAHCERDNLDAERKRLDAEITACTAERDAAWQEIDALKDRRNFLENEVAALTAQRNALAAEVDDLRNVNAGLRKENASQQALIAAVRSRSLRRLEAIKNQWDVDAALRADNARLRSALKMVEWVKDDFGEYSECPWCHENEETNHRPDCQRQAALR